MANNPTHSTKKNSISTGKENKVILMAEPSGKTKTIIPMKLNNIPSMQIINMMLKDKVTSLILGKIAMILYQLHISSKQKKEGYAQSPHKVINKSYVYF